ncbi:TIGR01244 family sulfur transferase [Poseidonocella sedimentorum]|uniref:TIGR01244 family protein n=1 Tax=Poseidonocella sedimentorum TaxID=871652 RepID=A0A1I6DSV4_9RHOB|nr:TIGR01244 family sulfur transferase [Poseidonocella sedimentorum]SFR08544.1 TIGR01244 family protein [Poseidonocella sedimentorum]
MQINRIDAALSVAPQLSPADMAELKRQGFGAVVCNRPDGEEPGQPNFAEIAKAAEAAGLVARYLPVTPGEFRDEDAARFAGMLRDLPGPVMAYCRTGTRSATLWSLGAAGERTLADILAATKSAGYDLDGLAARIAQAGHHAAPSGDGQ